jgi:ammonium transporter, Amt family
LLFHGSQVKHAFGYDDSLDAFGVHGIGRTIGALLPGVFASSVVNPIFRDHAGHALPIGLIDGNARQFLNQLAGVAIPWILASLGTLIILKIVDAAIGVQINVEQEIQGLDLTQHCEEAYNLEA